MHIRHVLKETKKVKLPSTGWYIFTLLLFLGVLIFEVTRMSYAQTSTSFQYPKKAPPYGNPEVSTGGGTYDPCSAGVFVGLSTKAFFEDDTITGYKANNGLCNATVAGSHICTTGEILKTIQCTDLSKYPGDDTKAWISNGPPGSTGKINDCGGWQVWNDVTTRGAQWKFNKTTGGRGFVEKCVDNTTALTPKLQFACCK